jgi:dihydroorotate dehydrogenase
MVYKGPGLAARIVADLPKLLAEDGFVTVSQAIGADHR